jgi:3-hydroxyisobutyrate dehydrogenase
MIKDDQVSKKVWSDAVDGALRAMKQGSVAVEMSTLTPAWVTELSQLAARQGVKFLDAPVSGSRPQAEARQLVIMAGGEPAAFEEAKDVLSATGHVHHVGPTGHGAVFKLAVNALLGIQTAAWAEVIGFFEKNGVNPTNALNLLTTMPVSSSVAAGNTKLMMARDFAPRFTNSLIAKDFRYLSETAEQAGSRMPISDAALRVFESASASMGEENFTSVIRLYE